MISCCDLIEEELLAMRAFLKYAAVIVFALSGGGLVLRLNCLDPFDFSD